MSRLGFLAVSTNGHALGNTIDLKSGCGYTSHPPSYHTNNLITTQRVLHHHNITMAAPPPNFQALAQALGNIAASVNASVNALQNLQADLGTVQQELSRLANQPTNQNLQNQLTQFQQTVNHLRTELRSR